MIVQHCSQQIVCRTDSMKISSKMEIDIFHRNDLCITATSRTAFNAEHWTQRRFSKRHNSIFPYPTQTVCQADRGGCFPFTRRSGSNCSYQHQLAIRPLCFLKEVIINLCFIISILFDIFFIDFTRFRYFRNPQWYCCLCDLNVCFNCCHVCCILLRMRLHITSFLQEQVTFLVSDSVFRETQANNGFVHPYMPQSKSFVPLLESVNESVP